MIAYIKAVRCQFIVYICHLSCLKCTMEVEILLEILLILSTESRGKLQDNKTAVNSYLINETRWKLKSTTCAENVT